MTLVDIVLVMVQKIKILLEKILEKDYLEQMVNGMENLEKVNGIQIKKMLQILQMEKVFHIKMEDQIFQNG